MTGAAVGNESLGRYSYIADTFRHYLGTLMLQVREDDRAHEWQVLCGLRDFGCLARQVSNRQRQDSKVALRDRQRVGAHD